MSTCPCCSGLKAENCCAPYHTGQTAPTALALMRSRYAAFVLGNGQYLSDTLSTEQRADFDIQEFIESAKGTKWLGLEIRKVRDGAESDDTGTVEFVARYQTGGETMVHHELAQFAREDGKWVFADCEMNPKEPPRTVQKVGRNDPCPCGSGKKFKKCCGAN